MRIAWITPTAHASTQDPHGLLPVVPDGQLGYLSSPVTMILAHLLQTDKIYYQTHVGQTRYNKDFEEFKIVDNGAHEQGSSIDTETLFEMFLDVSGSELVAPDVLFNAELTFDRTSDFLGQLRAKQMQGALDRFKWAPPIMSVMLVPQGHDQESWVSCLEKLSDLLSEVKWSTFTLGVSKDYDSHPQFPGGLESLFRLKNVVNLAKRFDRIHLLGWPRNPHTPGNLARYLKAVGLRVRSIDTAKPFVYAEHGIDLTKWVENYNPFPVYPRRTDTYFTKAFTPEQYGLAVRNRWVYHKLLTTTVDTVYSETSEVFSWMRS